jgi:hypothetical protein
MKRGRILVLAITVILGSLLFLYSPDILPVDGLQVHADPGGNRGSK